VPDVRLKLTVEYDGTDFRGWAAQPGLRTVEGVLREALAEVFPRFDALAVAGRTDTGVHARGNVATVDVQGGAPAVRAADALNAALPEDVAIVSSEEVAPDFHARHSACSRSYRYRIWRGRARSPLERRRAWWYPRRLDQERLDEAARLLLGVHDFRAFTPSETQHELFIRTVLRAQWIRRDNVLEFEITADSFLRHMVRTLVGTMLELPPERIGQLLEGAARSEAGSTAPPYGLYLERVVYS
jgi:tRNA pseudouridine38-40 synthase